MACRADGVAASRRLILETIATPGEIALLAPGATPPDLLAGAGARALLAGRALVEPALDELPRARGELALLLRPEGPPGLTARLLGVAALRFARVIVLPAAFTPHDDALLDALGRSGATVFARDPESLDLIAARCQARLALDLALLAPLEPGAPGPLGAWLASLAGAERVDTDRARTLIAAARLGRPVRILEGGDPGLAWIAEHGLADAVITPAPSSVAPRAAVPRPAPAALDEQARRTLAMLTRGAARSAPPAAGGAERITAVILTRDRPEYVRRALDSLAGAPGPEVLVIDQNSAPAPARALAAECAARAEVRLHRVERNLGCAGGRSLGARMTGREFVLFLDDDAELAPGALGHLLAELDREPGAGAVTATVLTPVGTIAHSGGWREATEELVTFGLIASGDPFASTSLAPSGPADWVPGGALLVRRELLEAFPLDERMFAYYEDNEWCERVAAARPGALRRSREALVLHHLTPKRPDGPSFAARSTAVELIAAHARFYERHGRLMGPWLFHFAPELTAQDGTRDLAAARVLMELVLAKGTDWLLASWMNGELDGLLGAHRLEVALAAVRDELAQVNREHDVTWTTLNSAHREIDEAVAEIHRLGRGLYERDEQIRWLHDRHETLVRIEEGGWWRLRGRLLALAAPARRLRRPR